MTEQELKEKIVKKLNIIQDYGYVCRIDGTSGTCHSVSNESVADALIAEVTGYVSEYKHRAEVVERALLNYCKRTISFPEEIMKKELNRAEKELAEDRKNE